jgi:hypothetical protein
MFDHSFLLPAATCYTGLYKKANAHFTAATLPVRVRFARAVYLGLLCFMGQDITNDTDVNNRAILIWVGSFCFFLKLVKPPARSPPWLRIWRGVIAIKGSQ